MPTQLQQIWSETEVNGAHPAPSLVLRQLKVDTCGTANFARALFSECKGRAHRNGSERTPELLLEFLTHTSEAVRLSACFVAVKEWAHQDVSLLRECVNTLVKISLNSRDLRNKEDAASLVHEVRASSPFAAAIVKKAEATERTRIATCRTGEFEALTNFIMPIAPPAEGENISTVCPDEVERPIAVDLRSFAMTTHRNLAMSLPRSAFFQRYSNLMAST